MLFPRNKFKVQIEIHTLTRLPQSSGSVQIRWHVCDSARAGTRGRTPAARIHEHQAKWEFETEFEYNIGVNTDKMLRSSPIELEVEWFPLGTKSKVDIGEVSLDIAQFADRPKEPVTVLLQNSRINCLLSLTLFVERIKGPANYTVRPFDAPTISTDLTAADVFKEDGKHTDKPDELHSYHKNSKNIIEKKAFGKYLRSFRESPMHLTSVDTLADIFKGGDGFGDLERQSIISVQPLADQLVEGKVPKRPLTEPELRQDYTSWVLSDSAR